MNNAKHPGSSEQRDQQASLHTLEDVVRAECRWEAPPALTASLLNLVQQASTLGVQAVDMLDMPDTPEPARPSRPHAWYRLTVLVLTIMTMAVSLAFAWQFYGLLGAELGLLALWQQVQPLPAQMLAWLYATLPASEGALSLLATIRDQVHWLLVAVVIWLALDGAAPDFSARQSTQQTVSS